ncbi:MAG: hypothetical protein KI785_06215 [Devosiaceae bacterium]|nr:hypothetical protein [Devosiaceae bacterium MH13]
MLYDTSRTDLLPHILAGRRARSQAATGMLRALFGGDRKPEPTRDTAQKGQPNGVVGASV